MPTFDPQDLVTKVKAMYRKVAEHPHGEFHFEMGRALAERLGYSPADLKRIPVEAIETFVGVGYHLQLADLKDEEQRSACCWAVGERCWRPSRSMSVPSKHRANPR